MKDHSDWQPSGNTMLNHLTCPLSVEMCVRRELDCMRSLGDSIQDSTPRPWTLAPSSTRQVPRSSLVAGRIQVLVVPEQQPAHSCGVRRILQSVSHTSVA